jgi:hypothetical protein
MSNDNGSNVIANIVHLHIPGSKLIIGEKPGEIEIFQNGELLVKFDNKGFTLTKNQSRTNYADIMEGGPREVAEFAILNKLEMDGIEVLQIK